MADTIERPTLWDEAEGEAASIQTELLQQIPDGPPGYRLRRIILTNFWLYDHQEFEIPHGRIFLAGDNRSGKSTVLTAAITLALDGDYRPERIDTFGKREKRIDYYIIGSKESNTPFIREQRTSYIALEFEWCDPDQPPFASELRRYWEQGEYEKARFLTIGLAFYGNRNSASPITPLRFLITDGSRLEQRISTVQGTGKNRRACDLKTFRKEVAEHGILCETLREYEQKVAHYLFNFTNIDTFRRLMKQLLYLRQPNLNSVLSLEAVRDYLDQSLPALPDELIRHAATTLELMDSLQNEIERRKKAYGAVERLHRGQQIVTMARARLAAWEYLYEEEKSTQARSEVQRLKRAMTRAENDLKRLRTRIEELQHEQIQLEGQVAALEGSEGLQAARRLSQAREGIGRWEKELSDQGQILEDAIGRREQTEQIIARERQSFEQVNQQSRQLLETLEQRARHVAYWQIAADQLAQTIQQLREFTLDAASPTLSTRITSLLEVSVNQRLDWLHTLQRLHQDLDRETIRLQDAQAQETQTYEALDAITIRFEQEREQVYTAQQELIDQLTLLLDQSDWQADMARLNEQAALLWSEASEPQASVERLGTFIQEYQRSLAEILDAIATRLNKLQHSLEELKEEQGARRVAASRARELYEQKLQEPEYIPIRSTHRQQARLRLQAHKIAAMPLYMLLDFAPEIESASPLAGSIEYLLEDAGLLDALVVLPTDAVAADALLKKEGLSDCRIESLYLEQRDRRPETRPLLRLDPQLAPLFGEDIASWAEVVQTLLDTLASVIAPSQLSDTTSVSPWRHGLLSGITGEGAARCIGKATRQREQQRAVDMLQQQWEELESTLATISQHIEHVEQQRQQQEALRSQLNATMKASAVEGQYSTLHTTLHILNRANQAYQEARSRAQGIRQQINTLKVRLQQEASSVPSFARAAEAVKQADEATRQLASEHKAVVSYLERLHTAWQEHRRAQRQLDREKPAEWRAEQAKRRAEQAVLQARAEMEMLETLVRETEQSGIDNLLARVQELQERSNSLPEELQKAREQHAKAEGIWENGQGDVVKTLERANEAQRRCDQTYESFLSLFEAYPVEMLSATRQHMGNRSRSEIAQEVLAEPFESQEDAYRERKNILEKHKNQEQNTLFKISNEVNSLLHDYGPQYDEEGIVRFLNVERANSLELLTMLGEEIRHHEQLLEVRERELFQNFLLEEMADTIGKYMTEAEQWVERMNAMLGQTAFVGEYYHLRWAPRKPDQSTNGSRLAQYHELLRRQVQTFKQEEIDGLLHTFRQEINSLRMLAQGANEATFAQSLASILDYRKWFQFELSIIRADRTRQQLTNRFFKRGSGAEQYVTLYIPFFAALSALYESAGKGAPRLIALDEAFDKVSVENTRKLLKFLAEQQFQWIMTGPRVTGEGAEIPACVKYTMFCQKELELAAGFPSFWSSDLSFAERRSL